MDYVINVVLSNGGIFMMESLIDALLDTVKILPYLLITFVLLQFIEHKLSKKNEKFLMANQRYGPAIGGFLGTLPQCGFSSMAANLFSNKVITIGTLIAVFLSTSDEMLPIMISEKVNFLLVLKIIGFKVLVGITIGFIIDLIYRKKKEDHEHIHDLCEDEHCDCEHDGIFLASLKHTLKIGLFILIVNLLINLIIFKVGEERLGSILLHHNILTYFLASLVGLIPNCAGSVVITELYLSNLISIGTLLAGLLTGSGIGILLLFRTNKHLKENISILSIIYCVGVLIGIITDLII